MRHADRPLSSRGSKPPAGKRGTARLFATLAAIGLVPVVVLGIALTISLRNEAQARGLSEGTSEARLIAQTAVEPLLDNGPVAAPLRARERDGLRRLVATAVSRGDVLRLRVRNLSGHVVFSNDNRGFKETIEDEALDAAHGRIVSRLTHLNGDNNDTGPLGPAAVEVYQPLRVGHSGRVVGVLELYLPYAPIARDVAASLHRLYVNLAIGLALLYLALLAITAFVSRGLRRQLALNVVQNAELVVARDEAVEASNMKSAFLANVSHEMRTPMNGVLGMNEILLDTPLGADQRSYAEQVRRSGEHMMSIIDDVLDVSRLESGRIELDPGDFDLRDALEAACACAHRDALAKGLAFELRIADEVPDHAHGDARRLRQVVANLVSNAVKFTETGSVDVRVSARQGSAGAVSLRVEVADSGIGVDPDALERMFEPFVQAEMSMTRTYGGTGLGLAIARELVELMGGLIGGESAPGRGSRFWFELELSTNASAASETTPVASRPVVAHAHSSA
jgi:signal transduction histidine kinase